MIKFIFKFFIYGGFYFLLFSIPIFGTPMFYHIEVYTRPYINKNLIEFTTWVPKFFSNARPPTEQILETTKIMEDHQKVVEDLSETLHK